ncbi:ATP-binding protein [Streptomyces sp. SH5]|uniref:ATP-binding protein n=1 Tax=Streptomyces sindenensis TaxID=67363 RepID=A0ABW6EG28_9ACTN|nr:ATP-binding protein [Streptomyces sp. SH5]WGP11377.1 ATP-binding protein [Streptomyces sp. SH5]
MSIWWSLHLRREAASVPLARRFLLGTMETAGVDPDISFDLSVALSEACANAVEHGGDRTVPGDSGDSGDSGGSGGSGTGRPCADSGQYRVTAYLDGEKCRIEVSDSGPGFPSRRALRPAAHSHRAETEAESGRGLDLIQQLSDHVQFGNRPGRGAVVSFDKVLKWREGALLTV